MTSTQKKFTNFRKIWLLLGVFTCLSGQAQILRWATSGDIQTLDPHAQNEGLTNSFNAHIYERLTSRDEQLKITPGLAERWVQTAPTVWRFYLRKEVRFQDGTVFDADDVVFSINRARQPSSAIAQYALPLGEVVKLDQHTIELKLQKPNPILLEHLDAVFIMSHKWSQSHGVTKPLSHKAKEETFASANANGTGPYSLYLRQPDSKNHLRRNTNYWGNKHGRAPGNLQEVIHLPITSAATRTAALLIGDVDFLQDVAPQDIEKLGDVPSLRLVKGPENRVMFLGFDQLRDDLVGLAKQSADRGGNPFKHLAVRQAIAYAIDVDSLRTHVMRGMSAPTWCLVPSPVPCAQTGLDGERPKFNVEVARQLLRQAGYANGFSANLDCPNNRYVNDAALCTAIAAMLAKVNVLLQVNLMPKAQFFQKLEKLESHFYLLGWGGAETDAQPTMDPLMHSKNGSLAKGEDNYGQFSNAELDRLIDLAAVEADPVKRLEYVGTALKIHSGQVHHLPLHRQVLVWGMRSNVTTPPAANNHFRAWLTNMGPPSIGLSSAPGQ